MYLANLILHSISSLTITRAIWLLLLVKIVQLLWQRRHYYYMSWKLPGPLSFPIIGNLHKLTNNSTKLLNEIDRMVEKYGSIYRVWLGPMFLVFVSDPRDIQAITTSPDALQKPVGYRYAKMWMGNGLFTAPYRIWHTQRKMIEQTFSTPVLDSYMNVFNSEGNVLVDQLRQHVNTNEYVDLWPFTCRCTLDIVGQTMLGVRFNCQLKNSITNAYDNEYMKSTATAFEVIIARVMKPWLTNDFIYKKSKYFEKFNKCLTVFDKVTKEVIDSRHDRALFLQKNRLSEQKTMIDELFSDNKANKLTDLDLKDHLNTMVATGADATGNALAMLFLLLAMHPEIQEKLYESIMENLGEDDSETFVSRNSIGKMTYLDYVIKESLRMFPGTALIVRYTTADVPLKSLDFTVKKNTPVAIGLKAVHMNKEFWGEDVKTFRPERFATHHKRHPYAFASFSTGPRNCVGYKYAMLSMKVVAIQMMRSYQFVTDEKLEDIKLCLTVMMKKVGGCQMKLVAR